MRKLYYKIILFFHNIYVSWLKWHTMKLIAKATKATTKLLPLLGKDPNYVPPPPPPPAPPTPIDETRAAWIVDLKQRPHKMYTVGSYEPWIKKPIDHPILQARKSWEAKSDLEKQGRKPVIDSPMVTQTTEIGEDAINSLREAVKNVEQACGIEGCGCRPESDKKDE